MANEYAVNNSLEWLNGNMHRNYPIRDDVVTMCTDGKTYLPSTILADLSISCVGSKLNKDNFFVSHINRSGYGIQVVISYNTGSSNIQCAQTNVIPIDINAGNTVEERTFELFPCTNIPSAYQELRTIDGQVIIGSCIDAVNAGSFVLSYANGRILSTLIHVYSTGLESIKFVDRNNSPIATWVDDFTLQAGDGIRFDVSGNTLIISRIPTDAEANAEFTNVEQVLQKIEELLGNPITSINNIAPSGGNINITGGDCTKVTASGGAGIVIDNTCSIPCCKSSDTADVAAALQSLEDAKTRMLNYFTAITTNINSMQSRLSSLIASRG